MAATETSAAPVTQSSHPDASPWNGSEKTKNPTSLPDIGSVTPNGWRWRQSRNVCQCPAAEDASDVAVTSEATTTANVTGRVRPTPARETATNRFSAAKGAAVPATRSQS